MLSLDNAFTREDVRGFHRPHPPLPGAQGRGGDRAQCRAQDRRPLRQPALRERRIHHRRDARRRHGRRGHHREPEARRRHPAQAEGRAPAEADRDPRRGLFPARRVLRAEQGAREGRRAGLRQSAQRRGRLGAAARPQHHQVAAAEILRLCDGRGAGLAQRAEAAFRGARPAEEMGLRGQPQDPRRQDARRRARLLRRAGQGARRPQLRHRRRGLQGQRPRAAEPPGLRRPRAALGDRAQVPGRAGGHHAQRHRDPGRPHRRADAGRQAGADHRRRRRGVERARCTTRTRSRARTCASATR